MDIGTEREIYTIEPLEDPVPREQPVESPAEVETPVEEPVPA